MKKPPKMSERAAEGVEISKYLEQDEEAEVWRVVEPNLALGDENHLGLNLLERCPEGLRCQDRQLISSSNLNTRDSNPCVLFSLQVQEPCIKEQRFVQDLDTTAPSRIIERNRSASKGSVEFFNEIL